MVARAYVTELRDVIRSLGVSDVRMEQGSLRCDVNTSLNRPGRGVGHPDRDEERQLAAQRRAGGPVGDHPAGRPCSTPAAGSPRRRGTSTRTPATPRRAAARRRRPTTGTSPSRTWCRSRPDPAWVAELKAALPELPRVHRRRLQEQWGLADLDMQSVLNAGAVELIEATVAAGATPAARPQVVAGRAGPAGQRDAASSWPTSAPTPAQVAELQELVDAGKLNDKLARTVLEGVVDGEGSPTEVMAGPRAGGRLRHRRAHRGRGRGDRRQPGHRRQDPRAARSRRPASLVGAVMKATRGQADAKTVRELILERLGVQG